MSNKGVNAEELLHAHHVDRQSRFTRTVADRQALVVPHLLHHDETIRIRQTVQVLVQAHAHVARQQEAAVDIVDACRKDAIKHVAQVFRTHTDHALNTIELDCI
eukprot:4951308-Prymnesium_polylepis.1